MAETVLQQGLQSAQQLGEEAPRELRLESAQSLEVPLREPELVLGPVVEEVVLRREPESEQAR